MKLSIFDYMSRCDMINYFSKAYVDQLYAFRDFTTPQFSISMANTHTFYLRIYNKLEDSKMLYYTYKKPLSKMAKKDTPFEKAKYNNIKRYTTH